MLSKIPTSDFSGLPFIGTEENELTVVLNSLALGGVEKIVLNWATRIYPKWKVHIILLWNIKEEYLVPDFVRVTRLETDEILSIF